MKYLVWRVGLSLPLLLLSIWAEGRETSKTYRSPEFLGRGYAGLATPRGEDALFYNQASLASTPAPKDRWYKKWVILSPLITASQAALDVSDVGDDDVKALEALRDSVGKPLHVGLDQFTGVTFGNAGVGLLLNARADGLVERDPLASGIEALDISYQRDLGLVGGYAHEILSGLRLGIGGKLLQRDVIRSYVTIADVDAIKNFQVSEYRNTGIGLGFDLAVQYEWDIFLKPTFGLQISDLGDTSFTGTDADKPEVGLIRESINFGLALTPPLPFGHGHYYFDIRDLGGKGESNFWKRLHMGVDYYYERWLGVVTGLNQGYFTAGLFSEFRYFRFDFGTYGEEVGERIGERPSRRYYIRFVSSL